MTVVDNKVHGSMTILTIKAAPHVSSHEITCRVNEIPKRSQVQSSPFRAPKSTVQTCRLPAVMRVGMAGGFAVNPQPLNLEPVNAYTLFIT